MRTLFLQAPSYDGFDGGAGSRYQARREIKSPCHPTGFACMCRRDGAGFEARRFDPASHQDA